MAKSLIKTVDGIGIWVRDDAKHTVLGIREVIGVIIGCLIPLILYMYNWAASGSPSISVTNAIAALVMIPIYSIIFSAGILVVGGAFNITLRTLPHYEVYPGSDKGIFILKTNNPAADQIAICKAAKEIEAKCPEIAANRRELDHIAGVLQITFSLF